MSFYAELKRRRVIKVCLAYLALFWVVIEVSTTIVPVLNLPEWIPAVVVWIGLVGLPFALVFSWIYELTPDGLRRDEDTDSSAIQVSPGARRLDIAIIALVTAAIALFAFDRFRAPTVSEATLPEAARPPAVTPDDRPAIAVLPFENLSNDPGRAIFADGLAEDLITRLSSWRAFPVIAGNSSFQFRGGDTNLAEAAQALGARYLVEGSVRQTEDRIRVNAQLIDATTGEQVWADRYDGEVGDVFALQDDLSGRIAASLVEDLNRAEGERARLQGTKDLEAWSLYQLGLQQENRFTREGFSQSRDWYTQAIAKDPRFATPQAHLVFVNLWEVVLGWNANPDETLTGALEMARRSVALDPRDPAAQAALGWAYVMNGDIDNGLEATERAVELNPSMSLATGWLSWNRLVASDPEGCIEAGLQTLRLNPLGAWSPIIYDNLSQAYWELGDYEAGLRAARRLLAGLPDYYFGHVYLAMNAVGLGRIDEARAAIAAARDAQPELSLELVQGMYGVARPEADARRNAALRQAGLE